MSGNGQSQPDAHFAAEAKLLGQIVKGLREAAGYTRRELARQVGVAPADLVDTESGRIRGRVLSRLMRHPLLSDLTARAAAAGIELGRWVVSNLAIAGTKKGGDQ